MQKKTFGERYNAAVAKNATLEGYEGITLRFIATNNDIEEG